MLVAEAALIPSWQSKEGKYSALGMAGIGTHAVRVRLWMDPAFALANYSKEAVDNNTSTRNLNATPKYYIILIILVCLSISL